MTVVRGTQSGGTAYGVPDARVQSEQDGAHYDYGELVADLRRENEQLQADYDAATLSEFRAWQFAGRYKAALDRIAVEMHPSKFETKLGACITATEIARAALAPSTPTDAAHNGGRA